MNKDNLRKGTAALRSDRYPQIRGLSHTDAGYCAFGVMAEVSGIGQWVPAMLYEDYHNYFYRTMLGEADLYEWYGGDFTRVHDEDGKQVTIAELNDDYGYDFHQIAALMEKEFDL